MDQDHFWKNTLLTHLPPVFDPKTAHFQGILGFSTAQNASPWAQNGLKTLGWWKIGLHPRGVTDVHFPTPPPPPFWPTVTGQ